MAAKTLKKRMFLEALMILVCFALCCLLYHVGSYRVVFLNLFFLPVVLSAFLLGRYGAGILALLCVVCASVVIALNTGTFAAPTSPLVTGLALTAWGAVLGITAILVGTLSDRSARKIDELHDAYLGVMEVLVQYLNSGDPKLKDRAVRLSELSQRVAIRMGLAEAEVDNIRVAALLQDIENIEVTARVIRKAVGTLSRENLKTPLEHTFHGSDLIRSFGLVLSGALPLLVDHGDCLQTSEEKDGTVATIEPVLGTRIIATVRRFLTLLSQEPCLGKPRQAIVALKRDLSGDHHPGIIHALAQVVLRPGDQAGVNEIEALTAANSYISLLLGTSSRKSEESSCGGADVTGASVDGDGELTPGRTGH
jgi:hypothetical protein